MRAKVRSSEFRVRRFRNKTSNYELMTPNWEEKNMADKKITKDMVIGDVLKVNPAAIKVIEKYFGTGCFTCPGMKMESISFGAMMHNLDPEVIVKELNALEG
jgi:hybrid cluster-associated redox disulfide protein